METIDAMMKMVAMKINTNPHFAGTRPKTVKNNATINTINDTTVKLSLNGNFSIMSLTS